MGFLIAAFARWGVPESIRRPMAMISTLIAVAGLCGLLWTCWLRSHDAEVIEEHEAEVTKSVATASASASAAASEAASDFRTEVEKRNDEARDAASDSASPLDAGLDRLRTKARPSHAPSR